MKKMFSACTCALLVCALFFAGLLCMGEVQAETALQKPAIPEFTLRFVDNSYDVPPTFSKDPFTGKNEMTQEGYHVENKTIEVKIKNQSFNRYVDSQGNHIMLQYDIRWKGHFDGYWVEYSSHNNGIYLGASNQIMVDGSLLYPNAPYTEATYIIGTNRYEGQFAFGYDGRLGNVSDGGKIDFQVQALIGYYNSIEVPPDSVYPRGNIQTVFTGVSSDWSKTQAITIGVSSDDTPNQNEPTPSPTFTADRPPQSEITIAGFSLFEFSLGVIIGAVISGLSIALVYEKRKTAKQKG